MVDYQLEARGKAEEIRDFLGVGDGALYDVFVDLAAVGLHVARRPLGSALDGAYAALPGRKDGIALVNTDCTLGRQRYTAAHELAHHLFDRDRQSIVDERIAEENQSLIDRRANRFAADLLMPPRGVEAWFAHVGANRYDAPTMLAFMFHFGVSYEAALNRWMSLGLIGDFARRRLDDALRGNVKQWARRLGYPIDLVSVSGDTVLPPAYLRTVFEVYQRGLISDARLAELLFTSEEDALAQAEAAGVVPPEDVADVQADG